MTDQSRRLSETNGFLQKILDHRPEDIPSRSPAAVAQFLYEYLHQREAHSNEPVPPVYGLGNTWVYCPPRSLWLPIFNEEMCALVARWDGVALRDEDGKNFRVGKGDDKAIVGMFINKCLANLRYGMDRKREEWMAHGESGLAFSDVFLRVEESGRSLALKTTVPHHTDRTIHGFELPMPNIPDIPSDISAKEWTLMMLEYLKNSGAEYLHRYLSSVWKDDPDEYENIRFLAQFAGVALLGKATNQRFMRALILQGPPGTGKSTFIKMLAGLFPDEATSSVPPHFFSEQDKISSMASSRYNFIEELSKDPIRSDSALRAVIDGARVQVRDPYVKNYFFSPRCAHLFGCNRLPNIPGADGATWRRFAILKLKNVVRDTANQIVDIDEVIKEKERHHLIAWALAGAADAFALNKYSIPKSAIEHLKEWSQEADSVSIYIREECSDHDGIPHKLVSTKGATKMVEFYRCYNHWARETGYSPVSKGEFKARLISQGIDVTKSGTTLALIHFNAEGEERHIKVMSMA